jgi:hypothetical protein
MKHGLAIGGSADLRRERRPPMNYPDESSLLRRGRCQHSPGIGDGMPRIAHGVIPAFLSFALSLAGLG